MRTEDGTNPEKRLEIRHPLIMVARKVTATKNPETAMMMRGAFHHPRGRDFRNPRFFRRWKNRGMRKASPSISWKERGKKRKLISTTRMMVMSISKVIRTCFLLNAVKNISFCHEGTSFWSGRLIRILPLKARDR